MTIPMVTNSGFDHDIVQNKEWQQEHCHNSSNFEELAHINILAPQMNIYWNQLKLVGIPGRMEIQVATAINFIGKIIFVWLPVTSGMLKFMPVARTQGHSNRGQSEDMNFLQGFDEPLVVFSHNTTYDICIWYIMVHVFVNFYLFASNFSDFGRSSQLLNGQGLPKVPKNSSEKLRISDDWSSLENAKLANFHLPTHRA